MKIEKPIAESKMPPPKKGGGHYKHLALYETIMKLPPGQVLPVTFDTEERAKKFAVAIQHSNFAEFRSFARDKTVYIRLRNEKDEIERKHILELREKAKQRKGGVLGANQGSAA